MTFLETVNYFEKNIANNPATPNSDMYQFLLKEKYRYILSKLLELKDFNFIDKYPVLVFYIYVENDFHYQALVFTKDITGKQLDIWLGLDTTLIPEECVFRLIIDTTDTDIETEEWKTVKQALIEL